MKRGVVYFISNGSAIKIGITQNSVRKRLGQIQRESAEPLTVIGVIPTPPASEYGAHQKFAHLRIGGEWFRHDPEILTYIEELYMQSTRELRQQLKAIRDSQHPARGWARNLVAALDDVTMGRLTEDEAKAPLQANMLAFKSTAPRFWEPGVVQLSAAEIAARLGLGHHAAPR